MSNAPTDHELRRARWRADHRGTREADMLVGGFADHYMAEMTREEFSWFEVLLEEQDADIMNWAFGKEEPPAHLLGQMMDKLKKLDYIRAFPG